MRALTERQKLVAFFSFVIVALLVIVHPVHAQTEQLSFLNNYFVTGDHIVRDFVPYSGQPTDGFVNGWISVPDRNHDLEGVPDGAEVVAAFLYWQVLEPTSPPSPDPGSSALFNGYSIAGDVVGSDQSACGSGTALVRSYRANVLPYLPVNANGSSQAATTHTVGLPVNPNRSPSLPGASLVIVYRVLSGAPWAPLKATVIYDGSWTLLSSGIGGLSQQMSGFYDALPSSGNDIAEAKITATWGSVHYDSTNGASFVGVGYPFGHGTWGQAVPDHASTITSGTSVYVPEQQCDVFTTAVFTTRVYSGDGDGLLDAWKTNQGYNDVRDNSWVPLTGAQLRWQTGPPQPDIFVQYDWMLGADGHSHHPPQAALDMVTQAFLKATVHVYFVPGNAIPEDTCADDRTQPPPLLCMFPGEPGVVAWKLGLEAIKAWPTNLNTTTNMCTGGICTPRFQPGRKDSYHYLLFGHSLGLPTWSVADPIYTLKSIVVTNGNATVTTSATLTSCPSRVTIDGAIATPNLNGVYPTITCPSPLDATFTISSVNANKTGSYTVADGTYLNTLPEPFLAVYASKTDCSIYPGCTDTTSGYSDVGGGDIAVTLGKWTWDNGQPIVSTDGECYVSSVHSYSSRCVNGLAGTVMHELGHNLTLLHGGRFYPNGSTTPETQPNCKPQYQSVMNYLFQVDLLSDAQGDRVPDYSWQGYLTYLDENNLSTTPGITPPLLYPYTKWFAPSLSPPAPAYRCDGTPNVTNETVYEVEGLANSNLGWSNGWDINFDGILGVLGDEGDDDWYNVDPRQIGASGNDNVGGAICPPNQSQCSNTYNAYLLGSYFFGPNGGLRAGGGGGLRAGGGGGLRAGGGGGLRAGGGGGLRAGGGGGLRAGGGGGVGEPNYNTIDSYPRPPRAVTATGATVKWKAATFGNIVQYNVFRVGTPNSIGCVYMGLTPPAGSTCVGADPYATNYSFTDNGYSEGSTYLVTTVDLDPNYVPRESTPQATQTTQAPLTLNVSPTGPLTYNSSATLNAQGGSSGGTVTYSVLSGPCSLSGNQLTATSGTGSCSVSATMAGDGTYNPVTSAPVTVALHRANATITVTPYNVIYDGNPHTATGTATGVKGEDLTSELNLSGTTHSAVGTYNDTWTFTDSTGNYNSTSGTVTDIINSWTASGFYPPVVPTASGATWVWNVVKGGSTVPLKFNIYAGGVQQTSIGAVQSGTVYVYSAQCISTGSVNTATDYLQNTGATALRYDTTAGQFIQNWKTPKGGGACYVAVMTAADGTTLQAYFKTN